jgi:hypothetical protein
MLAGATSGVMLRLEGERGAAADELDRLTLRLRRELLQLDVYDVRHGGVREAPDGARGIDPGTIGSLLVSLAGGPGALRAVVRVVRDWLGRSRARSVHLEIDGDVLEVTGIASANEDRLIEDWLSRRGRS